MAFLNQTQLLFQTDTLAYYFIEFVACPYLLERNIKKICLRCWEEIHEPITPLFKSYFGVPLRVWLAKSVRQHFPIDRYIAIRGKDVHMGDDAGKQTLPATHEANIT